MKIRGMGRSGKLGGTRLDLDCRRRHSPHVTSAILGWDVDPRILFTRTKKDTLDN